MADIYQVKDTGYLVDALGRRIVADSAAPCCGCGTCCPASMNFKVTPNFSNYGGCWNYGPPTIWSVADWSFANTSYNKANINVARCLAWGAPTTGGGIVSRWRWVDPTPANYVTTWYTAWDCPGAFLECAVSGLIWNITCNNGTYTISAGNCDQNETGTQHDVGATYHDCKGVGWSVPQQGYVPRDGAFCFWGTFTLPSCTSTVTLSTSDPNGGGAKVVPYGTPPLAMSVTVQAGGC